MQFEILNDWDSLLDEFPVEKRDIYFYKKYISLYEDNSHVAQCAMCKDEGKLMLLPFIRGDIKGYFDFETAYGYGGPISNNNDIEWNYKAICGLYDYLKENDYLCGFIRFHPLLSNQSLFPQETGGRYLEEKYDRQTVFIDTSVSIDEIWSGQISSKNRNMIRKAEKNQLCYRAEYDFASYDEFIDLYYATMRRLAAEEFYYFKRDYFYRLKESLFNNTFLGTVRKDGKLICAAIFMKCGLYGHYHLEGSDRNYSSLGANNFLLWKTACEMHKLGIKEFHLGGGTSSANDDPLFKFKKTFSCNELGFFIGKEIFLTDKYNEICKEWEINNAPKINIYGNRLLKYRY